MQILEVPRAELLQRARKFYFSLGIGDGASSLCQENFCYGLAKIHYAQEKLGMDPTATFISTPDETISHNKVRWQSGYGYGGKIVWGDGKDRLIFIDIKPNACGMLVGGMEQLPTPREIIENIDTIVSGEQFLDGILIKWDFKKGNHFIDIFETDPYDVANHHYPPYMFIIHCSAPELQVDEYTGMGFYYDKSPALRQLMETIKTPFGSVNYVQGEAAKRYFDLCMYARDFAARRRALAAKLIFGKYESISNAMHQGMISYNAIMLGAQSLAENPHQIFPIALKSDLPAYIIKGFPNLTVEQIEDMGFEKRAKKLGVYSYLRDFNAVPHGGGYALPPISRVIDVREYNGVRYFVCEQENQEGIIIITDTKELEYLYRGKKVVHRTEQLGLCQVEARLKPKFVLKM
jgi:hypothetical protein